MLTVGLGACRVGPPAVCKWPPTDSVRRPLDLGRWGDRVHLTDDAELAEDIAIRWADVNHGLRSGHFESRERYAQAVRGCAVSLFAMVEKSHGVTRAELLHALQERPNRFDIGLVIVFTGLFVVAAWIASGRLWQLYPPATDFATGAIMGSFLGIGGGASGALLLDQAWLLIESLRLSTGHLSYRADRIPWDHQWPAVFAIGTGLFWIAALMQYRRARRS